MLKRYHPLSCTASIRLMSEKDIETEDVKLFEECRYPDQRRHLCYGYISPLQDNLPWITNTSLDKNSHEPFDKAAYNSNMEELSDIDLFRSSAPEGEHVSKGDASSLEILVAAALGQSSLIEPGARTFEDLAGSTITEEEIRKGMGGVPMVRTSNVPLPSGERPLFFLPYSERGTQARLLDKTADDSEVDATTKPQIAMKTSSTKSRGKGESTSSRGINAGARDSSNPSLSTMQQKRARKRRRTVIESDTTEDEQSELTAGNSSDNNLTRQEKSPTPKRRPAKRRKAVQIQETEPNQAAKPIVDSTKRKMGLRMTEKEYNEAVVARREKDDDDMYTGLKNFRGRQRGWNGEHPAKFRKTLQAQDDDEQREIDNQLAKKKATEESDMRKKTTSVTNSLIQQPTRSDKEYEEWFGQAMSWREIGRIQTMDAVQQVEEDAYRYMMSRPFDHHQIGLQVRQEKKAAEIAQNKVENNEIAE
ncbi:hypothetical protein F5884DRAFT_745028 [Xylogone sp. PMI_703]|nr:hypothetical protein F5884DRAFT_745028 [Xylogone sp. PMI_703]